MSNSILNIPIDYEDAEDVLKSFNAMLLKSKMP